MLRWVLLIFLLNVVSAALFIGLVDRPVFDDSYNIRDVHNYAVLGLSRAALMSQRNPPGPAGFMWMAASVRLLQKDELRDARIAVLTSWILLVVAVLAGARHLRFEQLWYGALLVLLAFPYAAQASATILTEGPAMLFAMLGALAWVEFVSPAIGTLGPLTLGISGALVMGIAVTCRQYYLALLPAAAVLALYRWRQVPSPRSRWLAKILLPLIAAALPVLAMVLVWKGISSPDMASGAAYHYRWKAKAGLNLFRPLVALFYVAVYLLPITFPAMLCLKGRRRQIAAVAAIILGVVSTVFRFRFIQPGSLHALLRFASSVHQGALLFALISIVAIYNAVATGCLLWGSRESLSQCSPALFAFLIVVFFIVEQLGVGGNLPFYDRYILQVAPFLGLLAFALLPRLTTSRLVALFCYSGFSQFLLWRFAFGRIF